MKKHFLLLLVVLFTLPGVFAVSISPSLIQTNYVPGQQIDIPITISNTQGRIILTLMDSPLSQYATISEEEIILQQGEQKEIMLSVNVPPGVELYGVNSIRVEALVAPEDDGLLVVTTGVRARLEILFPYPDRYIELRGPNVEGQVVGQGQNAVINWAIVNLGNEPIQYQTNIWLVDSQGNQIYSQELEANNILAGQTQNLDYTLQTQELRPGSYSVFKQLNYDGKQITKDKIFRIGEKKISIVSYPKNLRDERINEFIITVRNEWNEEFNDVQAQIIIDGESATTQTSSLQRYPAQTKLTAYLDTTNLDIGEKQATIKLMFEDIEGNSLEIEEIKNITISTDSGETSKTNWLIISLSAVLLIFILISLGLIYSLLRKK